MTTMTSLVNKVNYALATAEKLQRGETTRLTVKQTAWVAGAVADALAAGANGNGGGSAYDYCSKLRCARGIHVLVSVAVAPNKAGVMRVGDCTCGQEG